MNMGVIKILRDITFVLFLWVFLPNLLKWLFPSNPIIALFIFLTIFILLVLLFLIYEKWKDEEEIKKFRKQMDTLRNSEWYWRY